MKRRLILIFLCLYALVGVQAQVSRNKKSAKGAERKDYSFKIAMDKNADGEVSVANLCTYVGKQLIDKYAFELSAPMPEDMARETIVITEDDINFDGYPDVDVNLGYVGGFSNNVQHEALLWGQQQHGFVPAKGYGEIGEPQLDAGLKAITTAMSAGPDERVITYYRWNGSELEEYLSNTWRMDDDGDAVDFSGMLNLPLWRIDAKLNGRIPVIIAYQKTSDGIVAGYIYYPKAKNPAPIMIAGRMSKQGGVEHYSLEEYQSDGSVSGIIDIDIQVEDCADYKLSGKWINPTTKKEFELTNILLCHEAPKWFTKSLLTPDRFKMAGQKVTIDGIQVK